MHEPGLLTAAAAELSEQTEGRQVRSVTLALGPNVDPEAAAAAWAGVSAGTEAAGAVVTWTRATDELNCLDCGGDYFGERLSRCPSCGGNGLVVHPAPELELVDWRT